MEQNFAPTLSNPGALGAIREHFAPQLSSISNPVWLKFHRSLLLNVCWDISISSGYDWLNYSLRDSQVSWANIGPTSGQQNRFWTNVGPTFIVVWAEITRADSRYAPSQWETLLQSNAVSHWLCANLESALNICMVKSWGPMVSVSNSD